MNRNAIAAVSAAALLAAPAAAQAHVTLQPKTTVAGGFTVLSVRVPNEEDKANTTKVVVQMPHGFASVAYQKVPGWTVAFKKEKLAKPIQTDDGPVTEEVREITFSGGAIAPGQFQDFPLSVQVPGKPGQTLTFKALQTYSNGDVVRWIGPPNSDHPAPQVKLIADTGASGATTTASNSTPAAAAPVDVSGKASKGLAIAALIVGALGLVAGGAGLASARRR